MSSRKRRSVEERVREAAAATLEAQQQVCFTDVAAGLGWLSFSPLNRWRQGRMECLEEALQAGPDMITAALDELGRWSTARGLLPAEIDYIAQSRDRHSLRFSRAGDPATERAYRTLWMSPDLSERQRARIVEKLSRPPELVVIDTKKEWTCDGCGRVLFGGSLLFMEDNAPHCMECAGMGDLEFLPSGNATLTRRAKKRSETAAVVVRWSRARKRYERQGLILEPEAVRAAEESILTPEERAERERLRGLDAE